MNLLKLLTILTFSMIGLVSAAMADSSGQNSNVCTYEKAEMVYFDAIEKQLDILTAAQKPEDAITMTCEPYFDLEWRDGWLYDYFKGYMKCTSKNGRTKHSWLSIYNIFIEDQNCELKKIKLIDEF
jgi:hypothetical protein